MSIAEMKRKIKGSANDAVILTIGSEDNDSDEEKEPIPWTIDSLNGDYTDENIVKSLIKNEDYTYNTKKSLREFHELFRLLCKSREEQYLESQ